MLNVKIRKAFPQAIIPAYQTLGAAGFDLHAALEEPVMVYSEARKLISTGLIFEIPDGYEGQIRSRSGLAIKSVISVLNSPGTVDSDYRGVVSVILINHGAYHFQVNPGDRIAQMVIAPVMRCNLVEVED